MCRWDTFSADRTEGQGEEVLTAGCWPKQVASMEENHGSDRNRSGNHQQPGGILERRNRTADSHGEGELSAAQCGWICGRGGLSGRGGGKGAADSLRPGHRGLLQTLHGNGEGILSGRQGLYAHGAFSHGPGADKTERGILPEGRDRGGRHNGSRLFQ